MADHSCPSGFYCAADGRCYRNGEVPPPDLGEPINMGGGDLQDNGDMAWPPPNDLTGLPGWNRVNVHVATGFHAVWGSGPNDIYVVGEEATILHWDGHDWLAQPTSINDPQIAFRSVWGTSAIDVWVSGTKNVFHSTGNGTWTPQAQGLPTTLEEFVGLWGGPNNMFVAGQWGKTLYHWDGSGSWSPHSLSKVVSPSAIWGPDASSGAFVYIGGQDPQNKGLVVDYIGVNETPESINSSALVRGIWGTGTASIYAVDAAGGVFHKTPSGPQGQLVWTPDTSGTQQPLNAVWGALSGDVYAVGSNGTIIATRSVKTWSPMNSTVDVNLYGVWGTSDGKQVYAVGDKGIVLTYSPP